MARNFRYYGKKRGHRRTGSRLFGRVGEVIFFATLTLLGCAGILIGIFWLVVPEWQIHHGFVEHSCTVIEKRVAEVQGEKGLLYRPEIKIDYEVQGVTYSPYTYDIHHTPLGIKADAQAVIDRFVDRQKYPCWYDPTEPGNAVLVRGYQWWIWGVLLIPASFAAIGVGGLVYRIVNWGKSAERRSATVRTGPAQELFDLPSGHDPKYPYVPDCSDIKSSPGTRLAYRLPLTHSPAWTLFGLLAAAITWNGAVLFFVVMAIQKLIEGQPTWLLMLFLIPFLVVGVALAAVFVRHLSETAGIGPTLVEVSAHPLLPAGQYRLFLSQSGNLNMKLLSISLVCEEEAVFRQGTNARTEVREVFHQPLLTSEHFEIRPGAPHETECDLSIPEEAMHSFRAHHNQVQWKILVRGSIAKSHDFARSFPVVVRPCPPPQSKTRAKS